MNIVIGILLFVHVVVCLLMILIILMQRSKQEGLGAAFGGGITDSMFGAQTSQVLVKATVYLAAGFFVLTILLANLYARRNNADNALQKALLAAPITAPAAPVANTVSAPAVPADAAATPLTAPTAPAKK